MIKVDIAKCTGCNRCEVACAFFHTGRVNRRLSRIKVMHLYERGIDFPVTCLQCCERFCLKCPEKALSIGDFGQIVLSPTRCNLCGACELNCPVGALEIFQNMVYVCDLCGGRPRCRDSCTEDAILWEKQQGESISLTAENTGSRGKNPSEKRERYAREKSKNLRKKWGETGA